MTFLLIVGEIDLSVGSVLGFLVIVFGVLATRWSLDPWLAAALVILFGIATGVLTALIRILLNIPSFIVTLAMLTAYRSLALIVSDERPMSMQPGRHLLLADRRVDLSHSVADRLDARRDDRRRDHPAVHALRLPRLCDGRKPQRGARLRHQHQPRQAHRVRDDRRPGRVGGGASLRLSARRRTVIGRRLRVPRHRRGDRRRRRAHGRRSARSSAPSSARSSSQSSPAASCCSASRRARPTSASAS